MDNTARHFRQRRLAGWLRTTAIAVGLMAVGYVAGTANGDRVAPLRAFAAAVGGADATAANPAVVRDERLPTTEQVSVGPQDKIDSPKSEPRECRPDQGIVNDCTFD